MPGQRPILAMSFIASLGVTFEVLSCTVPKESSNFWPLLIWIFYLILPIPMMISKRYSKDLFGMGIMNDSGQGKARDYMLFFTAGIMVSSIFLPIILARSPFDKPIVSIWCLLNENTTKQRCTNSSPLNFDLTDSSDLMYSSGSRQYTMPCNYCFILPLLQSIGWYLIVI